MQSAEFSTLIATYGEALLRYFARRVLRDDVEDLTADVLATAWVKRQEIPAGFELPWLYRTAGFVLANHRRKIRAIPTDDVPEEPAHNDPSLQVIEEDSVRRALATLSTKDRELLLLAAWEELDGEQLARALGMSRGGAASALSRARSRFSAALAAQEDAAHEHTGQVQEGRT